MINRHYLAGPPVDPAADAGGAALGQLFQQVLQGGGGDPDSPQAKNAAKFYGNVLGIGFRQLADSDEGQGALNRAFLTVALPLSIVAFVAGYYFAKRRG